jgi:hypothetical protein
LAKNLAKSGGILSRKRKVVVFRKFCTKSGGFMLLTQLFSMGSIGEGITNKINRQNGATKQ